MKTLFTLFITMLFPIVLFGQEGSGSVNGLVVDGTTGEEIIGATVLIKEIPGKGAATDIYGKYFIKNIPVGNYTLTVSFVTYQTQIIENVEVTDGAAKTINLTLSESVEELEEIVIQAEAIQNTTASMLVVQKKALAVQDGISSEQIELMGASNAAESVKSITGATVEGGKYMVMRGLGDRYSLTQMNGITLPSADPYRNSSSLDLIPSEMIDNVITVKTFTPDQPGNFTGGKLDITTKSLPEEFYFNFGVTTTYNTQSSFINNFLTDGSNGKMDWLGYDDGTRDRPNELDEYNDFIRFGATNASLILGSREGGISERTALDKTARAVTTEFNPTRASSPMNYGVKFSLGNQYELFGKPLGVNFGFNFDKGYKFYDNGAQGLFSDVNQDDLQVEQEYTKTQGDKATALGGLLSLAYQFSPNNEIILNTMYSHEGSNLSSNTNGFWRETGTPGFESVVTHFTERALLNLELSGKHYFENSGIKLGWTVSRVEVTQDEPDIRMWGFTYGFDEEGNQTDWGMNRSIVGILPSHFYRDLTDEQLNGKIDLTVPLGEKDNLIKVGGLYSKKSRVFNEFIYSYNHTDVRSTNHPDFLLFNKAEGDFDAYFSQNNAGLMGTFIDNSGDTRYGFGNVYSDQTQIQNSYTGTEIIGGVYAMGVFDITTKLKTIFGARGEITELESISNDERQEVGNISKFDILPSLSFIYKMGDNTNLRLGYSQTIARPNLREIAPFASIGGVGQNIVLGNPDLTRTLIQNLDVRYEFYPRPSELIAISAYYKSFENPIVWQLTPQASTAELKPVNSEDAIVAGIEAEYRKNLDFISPALASFTFATNVSVIYSKVQKGQEELDIIKEQQEQNKRADLKDWRPFPGQSPFIVNLMLSHFSEKLEWDNSISFNIWGDRLSYVTPALDPDVYEQSRPSLNFVSRKKVAKNFNMSVKVMNILNMKYSHQYDRGGADYIFNQYTEGINFSVGLSYKL